MLLSIIIPIYNAERVLNRTLDSVLNQGLDDTEWELILVDDGSTDNSLSICKSYQEKHPNLIRTISQNNSGVSCARNNGLHLATGDYVYFMDADDYLMEGGFRYLIDNFLRKEYDILTFYSETIKDFDQDHIPKEEIEGEIVYDGYGCDFLKKNWHIFIWNQMYKLDFLKSNNIFFQNMAISEDIMFNLHVWSKNPRVRIVSSKIYRYIHYNNNLQLTKRRDNSYLMKCIDSQMKLFTFMSELNELFVNKYSSNNIEKLFQSTFRSFMSRVLSSDLSTSEFKAIINTLSRLKLIPIRNNNTMYTKIMNFFIDYYFFFPFYKILYQRLFIPFILPKLSRE